MKKLIANLSLFLVMIGNVQAAVWIKLHEDGASRLMLDKQSVLQKDQLKRAWVKIEYKTTQKNLESPEKEYNLSKLLWFFDCTLQKSATSQVFQYLNNELVFSAGIDSKSAEFIEPVPETDVDIAMRYICLTDKSTIASSEAKSPSAKPNVNTSKPASVETKPEIKEDTPIEAPDVPVTKPVVKEETQAAKPKPAKTEANKAHWTYEGKEGPENWGKLNPDFSTCDAGRNQSPINIENTIHSSLKSLRGIQKFPAKDIVNNGHTIQVNFKEGNMVVLDSSAYQMKKVQFHAPSENRINDKAYPLEAHFVHSDSKGNLTIIAVMFKEGKANMGLAKLWSQLPEKEGEPINLKNRVIPSELIPDNRSYYRFTGSLTTPPCTEGVRWILMKTPMTASKEQIAAFEHTIHHHNNRPVQALNGRMVVE